MIVALSQSLIECRCHSSPLFLVSLQNPLLVQVLPLLEVETFLYNLRRSRLEHIKRHLFFLLLLLNVHAVYVLFVIRMAPLIDLGKEALLPLVQIHLSIRSGCLCSILVYVVNLLDLVLVHSEALWHLFARNSFNWLPLMSLLNGARPRHKVFMATISVGEFLVSLHILDSNILYNILRVILIQSV